MIENIAEQIRAKRIILQKRSGEGEPVKIPTVLNLSSDEVEITRRGTAALYIRGRLAANG